MEIFDDFYRLHGEIRMDYFIRFEKLQERLDSACDILRIPRRILPIVDHGTTRPKRHYTEFYDNTTRGLVAKKCESFIARFGHRLQKGVGH